jgi:transcriptional regulator with XRE-family HTH domain
MTQVQIADALHVACQWISQIECGQNVSVHTLARLANALDVSIESFFGSPKPARARPKRGRRPTPSS